MSASKHAARASCAAGPRYAACRPGLRPRCSCTVIRVCGPVVPCPTVCSVQCVKGRRAQAAALRWRGGAWWPGLTPFGLRLGT